MSDIFEKSPDAVTIKVGGKYFFVDWSVKGRGFGQYTFWKEGDKIMCDNECDSKESVKKVLCMLVDSAEFTDVT